MPAAGQKQLTTCFQLASFSSILVFNECLSPELSLLHEPCSLTTDRPPHMILLLVLPLGFRWVLFKTVFKKNSFNSLFSSLFILLSFGCFYIHFGTIHCYSNPTEHKWKELHIIQSTNFKLEPDNQVLQKLRQSFLGLLGSTSSSLKPKGNARTGGERSSSQPCRCSSEILLEIVQFLVATALAIVLIVSCSHYLDYLSYLHCLPIANILKFVLVGFSH